MKNSPFPKKSSHGSPRKPALPEPVVPGAAVSGPVLPGSVLPVLLVPCSLAPCFLAPCSLAPCSLCSWSRRPSFLPLSRRLAPLLRAEFPVRRFPVPKRTWGEGRNVPWRCLWPWCAAPSRSAFAGGMACVPVSDAEADGGEGRNVPCRCLWPWCAAPSRSAFAGGMACAPVSGAEADGGGRRKRQGAGLKKYDRTRTFGYCAVLSIKLWILASCDLADGLPACRLAGLLDRRMCLRSMLEAGFCK